MEESHVVEFSAPQPDLQTPDAQASQQKTESFSPLKIIFLGVTFVIILAALGTSSYLLASHFKTPSPTRITTKTKPTPNPSTESLTYTDPQNRFTFQYPSDWQTLVTNNAGSVLVTTPDIAQKAKQTLDAYEGVCAPFYPTIVFPQTLEDYQQYAANTVSNKDQTVTQQDITIHGIKAKLFDVQMDFKPCGNSNHFIDIFLSNGQQYYDLGFRYIDGLDNTKNKSIFDKLIQSFSLNQTTTATPSVDQATSTPTPMAVYTDKYFGYSISYPVSWTFRRTYDPDIQKGSPTDIQSGFDITQTINAIAQATIVVNVLDRHNASDVQSWISQYDLNYPKNATKENTIFGTLPAIKYSNFTESNHPTEYIYFLSGSHAYRIMYWEQAGISDNTRQIVNSFQP